MKCHLMRHFIRSSLFVKVYIYRYIQNEKGKGIFLYSRAGLTAEMYVHMALLVFNHLELSVNFLNVP